MKRFVHTLLLLVVCLASAAPGNPPASLARSEALAGEASLPGSAAGTPASAGLPLSISASCRLPN